MTSYAPTGRCTCCRLAIICLNAGADALLHWARAEQIGTLIRVPLAKGMLTGKYSGPQAVAMPPGDHRYERFQQPVTVDGLQKLPQLGFLQTPTRSMVQAALRFVLDHPGVSSVIAGAKTRQQIEENIAASALPALAPDECAQSPGHRRYDWHAKLE